MFNKQISASHLEHCSVGDRVTQPLRLAYNVLYVYGGSMTEYILRLRPSNHAIDLVIQSRGY